MKRRSAYCILLVAVSILFQPSTGFVDANNSTNFQDRPVALDNVVPLIPNVSQQGLIPSASSGACLLNDLQYSFSVPGEGTCGLPFLGLGIKVTGDQNLKLYIRYGQKVEIEGDRIVADYVSETVSHDEGIDIFAWSMLPLRGGTYFIAISNCGPETGNYELYATFYGIDFAGPVIFRAEVLSEKLLVHGLYLEGGSELLLNGTRQKHVTPDQQEPGCTLVVDKAGRRIGPGETVTLRVRFPNGLVTPKFKYTRPLE